MEFFRKYIEQIKLLCENSNVKALFAFGSVTTNSMNENSDIDLVVDIESSDPIEYSDNYFELKSGLKKLFNKEIDLLEQRAICNPFLKQQIDNTKVLVYGK